MQASLTCGVSFIERGCADRTGFYTDLAVSYKFDSFRKLNLGIQEESFEFPLLKGSAGKIKHYKAVFSAAEKHIDRQVSIFVPGNNPTNGIDCVFFKHLEVFWFYFLFFWLYSWFMRCI